MRYLNIGLTESDYELVQFAAQINALRPAMWARSTIVQAARSAAGIKNKIPPVKGSKPPPGHWYNPEAVAPDGRVGMYVNEGERWRYNEATRQHERVPTVGRPEAAGAALMRSLEEHAAAATYPDRAPIDDPYAAMDEAARNDPDL